MTLLNLLASGGGSDYILAVGRRVSDSVPREAYGARVQALTVQTQNPTVAAASLEIAGNGRTIIGVPNNGAFRKLWRWNGTAFIEDAANYTTVSYAFADFMYNLNGKWFVGIRKSSGAPSTFAVLKSDNGVSGWAEVTLPSLTTSIECMGYVGGYWIVAGGNGRSNFVYYSTDATTWVRVSVTSSIGVPLSVGGGNGVIVLCGSAGIATAPTSSAPTTFTLATPTGADDCRGGCVWNGTRFILAARDDTNNNLHCWYSTDAASWTKGVLVASFASGNFIQNSMLLHRAKFVCLFGSFGATPFGVAITTNGQDISYDLSGVEVRRKAGA